MLKKPFKLGNTTLPSNIFYAPLAGCSNFPYRSLGSRYSPGLMYCEMVKMEPLLRYDPDTFALLDYSPGMHPIGAQLCGSNPKLARACAKILEDLGFDVIDLNCGCPVDKVTKDGSGSGMLKTPHLIGEILQEMVAAVKIPVTVKIRAGWDDEHINAPLVTQIAEEAGAAAICIHGRTRSQAYKGQGNRDHIKASKQVAKEILVIGNGDIFDGPSAAHMFEHTACDAILVSRGTMGQPWICEDIERYLEGLPPLNRGPQEVSQALLEYLKISQEHLTPKRVVLEMRKAALWYLKPFNSVEVKKIRQAFAGLSDLKKAKELIQNLPEQLSSV